MSIRYSPEQLKHLRESPLVVKPPGLPPPEQWMGPPTDPTRTKPTNDRAKNHDSNLSLDQTNRRPAAERHISRNSANPDDIILGPPKTNFLSATSIRNAGKPSDSADRPPPRDADSRDRYNFRKTGEGDTERTREGRNNNLRPKRAEGDQDSDGWSTVKPRKSFGTEGAERFNGRMGVDRHKDDRRFKDREDRDAKERPRGFDTFSRDKDGEHDPDRDNRRNGAGRGRNESWFKDRDNRDNNENVPPARDRNSNGDRFVDRSRGWREKERDDRGDRAGDRALDRGGDRDRGDRRWDRDREQRQEREPEWMDEPAEDKNQTHTQADFEKWKEQMAGKDKVGKTPVDDGPSKADAGDSFFGLDQPKTETPLEIDTGPDKFFGMWAAPKEEPSPETGVESKKEGVVKSKTVGKASRFTSFFTPTEEVPRRQTEPPAPMPAAPPPPEGFAGLFQNNAQSSEDKEAFQMLLQKLHRQTLGSSGSTPPANPSMQPKPPAMEKMQNNQIPPPEAFQQYRPERQEESRSSTRNSQPGIQELLAQRQVAGSQPTSRPEQMLQELMGQRQHALSQSSVRSDQQQQPMRTTNTEFLMGLMQSAKAAPDPQRSEQVLLRMPPKSVDRQMQQQMMEQEMQREAAAQRERSASQRQARPQPPPGFFDDPAFQRGPPPQHERQSGNPPQPTQILQRPPPPGLDLGWERQPQLPPPQHRLAQNIAPPPGLPGGPNRGMPMPQQMFPPGFPMGNFPPPDVMGGPPRNMQMQPPPGFYNAPPGFLPPGMPGFQGPEGMAFGGPYDGRGPPPQGAYRRQ